MKNTNNINMFNLDSSIMTFNNILPIFTPFEIWVYSKLQNPIM